MDRKLRVLVVDDNPSFRFVAAEELKMREFDVIAATGDGHSALQLINEEQPDAVLLDLVIPGVDGIGVLKSVTSSALKRKPNIIVATAMSTEYSLRECVRWGAAYYMLKPFDFDLLAQRLNELSLQTNSKSHAEMARENNLLGDIYGGIDINSFTKSRRHHPISSTANDMETEITRLILEMGVPAHIKGYQYLRSSILLAVEDSDVVNAVTKVLYPTVAKKYATTSTRVERAIRHAIEVAWERGDLDVLHSIFGYSVSGTRGKPTNSEFIALISDKIRLETKKVV